MKFSVKSPTSSFFFAAANRSVRSASRKAKSFIFPAASVKGTASDLLKNQPTTIARVRTNKVTNTWRPRLAAVAELMIC